MRTTSRYIWIVGTAYLLVTIVLITLKYVLWGTSVAYIPYGIQKWIVWPFHWIADPLLANGDVVPVVSWSGRADEAAAWRELLIYGITGAAFYSSIVAVVAIMRQRRRI